MDSNFTSNNSSLYTFNISAKLGPEYVGYLNDIVRVLLIQFTIQLMYFISDSQQYPFFTANFFVMCLYLVLGVTMYWLIFKKIVVLI